MKLWQKNVLLLLLVAFLIAVPLFALRDAPFEGADAQAEELITQNHPDYEPWFQPILEPPSGEVESLFFALQAGLGAGVLGFLLGRITAPNRRGRTDGN